MVRTRDVATGSIVALIALVSAVYASRLPAELAVHFDAAGEPNSYTSKEFFFASYLLLAVGVAVLFAVLPRIDPLGQNFEEFQKVYDATAVVTIGFMAYIFGLVLAYNLGFEFGMIQATAPATGVLYLLLALLVQRAEQNWFVGIRTPWTLSDERVWDRTHKHAAPLFAIAGILSFGAVLFPDYALFLMVGPITAVSLWTVVYSFAIYRRVDHG
jgi:uncharacterized membrane protein